jgi:predicted ATP-dependent protease
MLRKDVREAVENGNFHIYPIETVDEGIEVLTGIPAGEKQEDGSYPEGSINAMVKARLEEMAKQLTEFGKREEEKSE